MCISMFYDERLFDEPSYFGVVMKDGRRFKVKRIPSCKLGPVVGDIPYEIVKDACFIIDINTAEYIMTLQEPKPEHILADECNKWGEYNGNS